MKRTTALAVVIFLLAGAFPWSVHAQSPYALSRKNEVFFATAVAGLAVTDLLLYTQVVRPLTPVDIAQLDRNDVNGFDRFATELHSKEADLRSHVGLFVPGAMAFTGSLLLPKADERASYRKDAFTLLVMLAETNLMTLGLTDVAKSASLRIRPFAYNPSVAPSKKYTRNARKSFFSAHTSLSTANSYFFAQVFNDYFPDSKWRFAVWGLAASVPAWTGMERVLAGEHFPSDVMVAYGVGAFLGLVVPRLHRRQDETSSAELQWIPTLSADGAGVFVRF